MVQKSSGCARPLLLFRLHSIDGRPVGLSALTPGWRGHLYPRTYMWRDEHAQQRLSGQHGPALNGVLPAFSTLRFHLKTTEKPAPDDRSGWPP